MSATQVTSGSQEQIILHSEGMLLQVHRQHLLRAALASPLLPAVRVCEYAGVVLYRKHLGCFLVGFALLLRLRSRKTPNTQPELRLGLVEGA